MPQPKQYRWHKLAEHEAALELGANGMATVTVDEKKLCISKQQGGWHACAAKCPHAGALMSEGYVDALGNIVCPLHRYKFSLANGRNVSGEGYHLKLYPVEQRADGIYVGLEENSLLSWLK